MARSDREGRRRVVVTIGHSGEEVTMSWRRLALVTVSVVLGLLFGAVPAAPQGGSKPNTWTPPKTPWGHPDLQGTYTNNTVVPLERPANLADKAELTDAEVAERLQKHRDTLFARRQGDTGFYACHEGNYAMPNSLSGARAQEARTGASDKP
jgi:hypothetical protein